MIVNGRLITVEGLRYTSDPQLFPRIKAELTATVYLSPLAQGVTAGRDPPGPRRQHAGHYDHPGDTGVWRFHARPGTASGPDCNSHSIEESAMKIFLLDLWNDLREKRLWPVAVVLLASLVAVPVLLARPAEEPSAPPQPPAAVSEASKESDLEQLAKVKLADEEPGDGSTLGVFDPDNPFTPPKAAVKSESDQAPRADAGPDSSESPQGPEPAKTDDGTAGGGGFRRRRSGRDHGRHRRRHGRRRWRYPAPDHGGLQVRGRRDLQLEWPRPRVKGLEKLDILPSEASPLLIFMGVTENAGNAVFLVDSTLDAAGEGPCRPSAPSAPSFISARARSTSSPTTTATPTPCAWTRSVGSSSARPRAARTSSVGRPARPLAHPGVRRVAHPSYCRFRDGVHRDAARLKP